MSKTFIQLTKIMGEQRAAEGNPVENEEAEDDGLVATQTQDRPQITKDTLVAVDAIRDFYPRRGDQPGTRINFGPRSGIIVTETVEQVAEKLDRAADVVIVR
jgi:hypothetical protein